MLAVGGLLLAAGLAHGAWAGLEPPQPASVTARAVTLVTDPEVDGGEVTAVIRLDGRRLEAEADDGPEAATFAAALAGERPVLSGRIVPVTGRPDLAVRHVAGRLVVDAIGPVGAADPVSTVANHLRRAVVRGAQPLGEDATALLTGILFGDDRAQPPATTDDFRAAGLSHLLAVSGQNVAFVLVVAGVGLGRLGLGSRFLAVLVVLAFFALLTRFEPSVLRATAMAAVAAGATFGGRAVSRPRVLALAVAALLLVDPILVHSVGFGLSVAATAGIVVLAARLEPRLPGPAAVREPAAVTLAAQVAVAPLLATVFGGVPLVSVPANLLAGPAAGFVMVWGLVAGPVAGFVPGAGPGCCTSRPAWRSAWLDLVARGAAATPLGELRAPHLAVLAAAALAVHGRPALRRPAVVVVLAVLATPGLLLARQVPLTGRAVATGAQVWRDGAAVVVRLDGRARAAPGPRRPPPARRASGRPRPAERIVAVGGRDGRGRGDAGERRGHRARRRPTVRRTRSLRQGPFAAEAMTVTADRVQWLVRVDPASVRSADVRGARSPPLRHHPSGPGHGDPQPDAGLVLRPGRHLGLRRLPGHRRATGRPTAPTSSTWAGSRRGPGPRSLKPRRWTGSFPRWRPSSPASTSRSASTPSGPRWPAPAMPPVRSSATTSPASPTPATCPRPPKPAPRWWPPTSAWPLGSLTPSPSTSDVSAEVCAFLADRAAQAVAAGIPAERVMVDAGLDLGKTPTQSALLLKRSDDLVALGFPVFLSASNKRFLGELVGTEVHDRREASLAAHALGIAKGCRILRAHDVRGSRRVADVMAAILSRT